MSEFCDECGVSLDLHDFMDDDPCGEAMEEADRIDRLTLRMFGGFVR